jgi:DcmR-like sensory protein
VTPTQTRGEAARADWPSTGASSHAVQFYESDGHLLDLLTRFVGTALVGGDIAIAIATKSHHDGLSRRLQANGLEVGVPREQGRFIALDAGTALGEISRGGSVDHGLFAQVFGALMDAVSRTAGRRIVAFGEMVSLLWAREQIESAIRVEEWWNDLALRYQFSLCCAYPMGGFANRHAAPFLKICAQHSHVFTAPRRSAATGFR